MLKGKLDESGKKEFKDNLEKLNQKVEDDKQKKKEKKLKNRADIEEQILLNVSN